jgi:hypothetical protein
MKRSIHILFTIFLLIFTVLAALPVSAGKLLTDGVSILNPKQNIHGDGYEWHNPSDTLTLTNLNINTDDDYGLKLPDGATVILEGKNYIKASVAALYIGGNVIFRGSGSLTLDGGEYGILCNSTKGNHKLTITEGTYTITGGTDGIHSEFQKVAFSGGKITVTGSSGYSVNVRDFQTGNNVTVKATGSFRSSYSMLLQAANLTIESKEPALIADKYLKLESMTLKAGDNLTSLAAVDSYTNENALATVSTFDRSRHSLIFGDSVPFFVDILLLIVVLAGLASVIVVPILVKKKKVQAAIAARDAAEAEAKRLKKLNKKNAKG